MIAQYDTLSFTSLDTITKRRQRCRKNVPSNRHVNHNANETANNQRATLQVTQPMN